MAVGSGGSNAKSSSRRWSDLPIELLSAILSQLSCLDDRIRFAAVCKPWRCVWRQEPPSTWTWMISPDPDGERCLLFSLSDHASYMTLDLPEAHRGARICGSFENWLVMADPDHGGGNFLLNPFSRASIPLPHQTTTTNKRGEKVTRRSCDALQRKCKKVILSSSPTTSSSSDEEDDQSSAASAAVIVAALASHGLSICRAQGREWSTSKPNGPYFHDIIFYQGLLHGITCNAEVYIIEVVGNEQITRLKRFEIQPHADGYFDNIWLRGHTLYLVESRGRLLMVLKFWDFDFECRNPTGFTTTGFKVLMLQPSPPRPRWVEVKSLGGHALFLGISCSKSVPSTRYVGVEGDCIYFTDDCWSSLTCLDSGVFSMKDGSIMVFPPAQSVASRLKRSNPRQPPPLWLQFTQEAASTPTASISS